MSDPALLYVLSEPKPTLPLSVFHDWYNNEHGPLRLQLPSIKNGFRYKSADDQKPGWVAWYDVESTASLKEPSYTRLRATRSEREAKLVENDLEKLDRRIYKLLSLQGAAWPSSGGPVLIAVTTTVDKENPAAVEDLIKWYIEEHIPLLAKVPGWIGSRLYELTDNLSDVPSKTVETLALHEYQAENGLGGPEFKAATNTEWRTKVISNVADVNRRVFHRSYVFGPAPRDLENASSPIDSVFTHDNVEFRYRYEGSSAPDSPVIVFSNSFLTDLHIWDTVIATLAKKFPSYRFLRYNTRGYGSIDKSTPGPITFDVLTDDVAALLDALHIPKVHAIVGVSMGGVTSLNFAIRYPERVDRFVACDHNIASSDDGTKAWNERIEMAKKEGMPPLAEQTVKRWFLPSSLKNGEPEPIKAVRDMILKADISGSERSVYSLCDFDLSEKIKEVETPGLFVVGDSDGVLPAAMGDFSKKLKNGKFVVVKDSGHLPMVENPDGFIEAVENFLR